MNVFDRIYALHKQLAGTRHPIAKTTLEERLECSPATVKRIIREMRLYLDAPIEYGREYNGYYYADEADAHFELPGLQGALAFHTTVPDETPTCFTSMSLDRFRCWPWISCWRPCSQGLL